MKAAFQAAGASACGGIRADGGRDRNGAKMNRLQEKRNHIRHHCEGRLTLLHTQCQSRQIEAKLINFSAAGVSFCTRQPLRPGTTIIVRVSGENYRNLSSDIDCQLPSMGLVTIKWCQESTRHGRPIHEMGAVYVMPY